jgi:hypothetical protein
MHRSPLSEEDVTNRATTSTSTQEPCKYLTQTQTLQVGCISDQQYSLKTKLCYPNHQYNRYDEVNDNNNENSQTPFSSSTSSFKLTTTAYTQLESEINLVCLAYWKSDGNHIIVSRTMTNEILCSVSFFVLCKINFKSLKLTNT